MIINTKNLQQAKNQINKAKKPIIVKAQSLEFNRKILEYGKFDILLDIHSPEIKSTQIQRDKIKSLASGLNHVLAKIAHKNKIALGINLTSIIKLEKKQKAIQLARIKQNIKIARKAKTNILVLNEKDKLNAQSLLLSLKASNRQAKAAVS
jgi:RNase P/RNase MRP subunit p30